MTIGLVYIVDDNQDVRDSTAALLSAYGANVLGFPSSESFFVECESHQPDCAIIDVRMPGLNGMEVLSVIRQRGWLFRVIMITGHGDVDMAVRAMKLGAVDFLQKPFRPEHLLIAIDQKAEAGKLVRSQQREAAMQSTDVHKKERLYGLSPREREVLQLVRKGFSSKEIAVQLQITPATVNNHRTIIRDKLKVKSLAHLLSMPELGD